MAADLRRSQAPRDRSYSDFKLIGALGSDFVSFNGDMVCYYRVGTQTEPAVTLEYAFQPYKEYQAIHVRVVQNPGHVDNTYGTNAIGWKDGHAFSDLADDDQAELSIFDPNGGIILRFAIDYISKNSSFPSGFGSDVKIITGSSSALLDAMTSLDRNLNEKGWSSFVENSPPTDANYSPSAAAPNWNYLVVYDVWINTAAIGPAGIGEVSLDFVHASPSKVGENTVDVTPLPCPPDWEDPPADDPPANDPFADDSRGDDPPGDDPPGDDPPGDDPPGDDPPK